jgi:hypothetical protein
MTKSLLETMSIITIKIFWEMSTRSHGVTLQSKKVNFTLEQATKAQRGSKGIALLFL